MLYIKIRTVGYIIAGIIVTWIWIEHKLKKTPIIKREPKSEAQKTKRIRIEKRIDFAAVIVILFFWIMVGIPNIMDLPYLVTNNLQEIEGTVTDGNTVVEDSMKNRWVTIYDDITGEEKTIRYYGKGVGKGDRVKGRVLPHSEWADIIVIEEEE